MKKILIAKPIDEIISMRLDYKSTRQEVESFGVKADLNYLKSATFKKTFKSWDIAKQRSFMRTLGGDVNLKNGKTLEFLNE